MPLPRRRQEDSSVPHPQRLSSRASSHNGSTARKQPDTRRHRSARVPTQIHRLRHHRLILSGLVNQVLSFPSRRKVSYKESGVYRSDTTGRALFTESALLPLVIYYFIRTFAALPGCTAICIAESAVPPTIVPRAATRPAEVTMAVLSPLAKNLYTDCHFGKSLGSISHWQPLTKR